MNSKINNYKKYYLISMCLVLMTLGLVFFMYYPGYYAGALSGGKLIFLVLIVYILISLSMTFLIFNSREISVKARLSGMALMQLVSLVCGVVTIFYTRPVYAVFNVDRFTVVAANDIPPAEMNKAPQLTLPWTGPQVIAAKSPTDKKELDRITFSSIESGIDLPHMPQYYLPYEQVADDVKSRIQSLESLVGLQPEQERTKAKSLIAETLVKRGLLAKDVGYLPLQARAQDMAVLVKRNDASIIEILPITPW